MLPMGVGVGMCQFNFLAQSAGTKDHRGCRVHDMISFKASFLHKVDSIAAFFLLLLPHPTLGQAIFWPEKFSQKHSKRTPSLQNVYRDF